MDNIVKISLILLKRHSSQNHTYHTIILIISFLFSSFNLFIIILFGESERSFQDIGVAYIQAP
jgi:hypothetical protein